MIEITAKIKEDVDNYCVAKYGKMFNTRLGASIVGHDCKRYLWYVFRWCFKQKNDARMLRLGERGNLEEARFIEYLRGIGCQVWAFDDETDPLYYCAEDETYYLKSQVMKNPDGTLAASAVPIPKFNEDYNWHFAMAKAQGIVFPQYRMTGVEGHLGGSLDGIVKLPSRYNYDKPLLLEGKTHGTGTGFNKLVEQGMKATKRDHYIQNSLYGYKYGFENVLYISTNKNDDSLHIEIEKLDWELAKTVEAKAESIILSQVAPPKVSAKPDSMKCNSCAAKAICHEGATIERNCRSCKNASAYPNAEWFCAIHNDVIPKHIISQACNSYESIV